LEELGGSMKLIKLIKSIFTLPVFIIGIAMIMIIQVDKIHSEDIKAKIFAIVVTLFLIFFLLELYLDLTKNEFTTKKYIIIIDIINLVLFSVMCYFNFIKFNKLVEDFLWMRYKIISSSALILTLLEVLNSFLKRQRFEKNKDEIE
jgi:hypothetical protein